MFKSIMGFVAPTTGQVSITGQPVREALRRNMISYVPQTEDVDWNFPVLVEDVVMMGRYGHMGFLRMPSARDKRAVREALERVDLAAYAKCQIGELSGGQKKRVFVARALAQEGQILLFDEPFAGVDIRTEESLTTSSSSTAPFWPSGRLRPPSPSGTSCSPLAACCATCTSAARTCTRIATSVVSRF